MVRGALSRLSAENFSQITTSFTTRHIGWERISCLSPRFFCRVRAPLSFLEPITFMFTKFRPPRGKYRRIRVRVHKLRTCSAGRSAAAMSFCKSMARRWIRKRAAPCCTGGGFSSGRLCIRTCTRRFAGGNFQSYPPRDRSTGYSRSHR